MKLSTCICFSFKYNLDNDFDYVFITSFSLSCSKGTVTSILSIYLHKNQSVFVLEYLDLCLVA